MARAGARTTRRGVVTVAAGLLLAGCTGSGSDGGDAGVGTTDGASPGDSGDAGTAATTTAAGERDPDDPGESTYETADGGVVRSGDVERAIHAEVNAIREDRGREPLAVGPYLASVARAHSEDMAARDYFSHANPEGERPSDRYGDEWREDCPGGIGENIAAYADASGDSAGEIASTLVAQWMGSDAHRAAILSDSFTREGVGVYLHTYEEGGRTVVEPVATQLFCGADG